MKMPGFTADKSLYIAKGYYRSVSEVTGAAQVLSQSGVVVYSATCCMKDSLGRRRCWNCMEGMDADPGWEVVDYDI